MRTPHRIDAGLEGEALPWAIVCDFDGTAILDDIADALSQHYIGEEAWRDMNARYEGIGKIMYACQRAGIAKVSFITEPPATGG